VEKLRKALEKRTAVFRGLQAGKQSSVKNGAQEVLARHSGSKLDGPLAGSVEDKQQLDRVAAYAVRDDIWRAGNH